MRCTLVRLLVLCAAIIVPTSAAFSQGEKGRKVALLVGVDKYEESTGLRSLSYSEKDITDLAAVLEKLGYEVTLLTRAEWKKQDNDVLRPTAKNIQRHLATVLTNRKPADTVLIAFSGHSTRLRGSNNRVSYCPSETNLADEKSLVAIDEVFAAMESCKAGSKVLLMDAFRNDSRSSIADPKGGTVALFSCSIGEKSFESNTLKRGFMMHFVIEGLAGKAANKASEVTWLGLVAFVVDAVPGAVRKEKGPQVEQTPEVLGKSRAMVLAKPDLVDLAKDDPKVWKVKLSNTETLELVRIDPSTKQDKGVFTMGSTKEQLAFLKKKWDYAPSNEPGHTCKLTKPYYAGRHAVTRGQFRAFVEAEKYVTEAEAGEGAYGWVPQKKTWAADKKYTWRNGGFPQDDTHPVVNVSWNDAVKFCAWATKQAQQQQTGNPKFEIRLPTEAEWEYACRAGSTTLYHFGDDEEDLAKYGNVADAKFRAATRLMGPGIKGDDGHVFTAPVGKFKPNNFGLFDMHGNVWQWCSDHYSENSYTTTDRTDPHGPATGSLRVYRGGSYTADPLYCRSASRSGHLPAHRADYFGFRAAGSAGK